LHDTRTRNWYQFSGTSFWYQFLVRMSWALAYISTFSLCDFLRHRSQRLNYSFVILVSI